mgnify:CR=1 FL=1
MNIENAILSSDETYSRRIKQLCEFTSNQIAAGEVVERPSSAVKELIENSLDAGATSIEVMYSEGGKSYLSVRDNGYGINKDDLCLALSRHATSKIRSSEDLMNISSLGFRGEALPSIGAVSGMTITSRDFDDSDTYEISCKFGKTSEVKPSKHIDGTLIEIEDLFQSMPARLKFLKSDRSESLAILDVVKKLALSKPEVAFKLYELRPNQTPREILNLERQVGENCFAERINLTLKNSFIENAHLVSVDSSDIKVFGFISSPTYSSGNSINNYFYVNGRFVKDKQLFAFVRSSYGDSLSKDRFPAVILFISVPRDAVDVNVHPSKLEIKFREPSAIKIKIKEAIRETLNLNKFSARQHLNKKAYSYMSYGSEKKGIEKFDEDIGNFELKKNYQSEFSLQGVSQNNKEISLDNELAELSDQPLGVPKAHLFKNFIVSQTQDELVIVDQHAAHERIIFEKLKTQKEKGCIAIQELLIPEIIESTVPEVERILSKQEILKILGLEIESFGPTSICIRGVPALLGNVNPKILFEDIVQEIAKYETLEELMSKIDKVFSSMACHGSVRSGRILKYEEMDALLREMEKTPQAEQCNHGRPTFLKLDIRKINSLFGRS